MQTTLRFTPVPRLAWLLVVIGLSLALVAAALLAGSRRQPVPPFGVARNGAVAYGAADGDIYALDRATGMSTAIIVGPTHDETPDFSRDGSMLVFARKSETAGRWHLMVADANGADQRALTGPIYPSWNEWSPDGSHVAVIDTAGSSATLMIVDVATPSQGRTLDLGDVVPDGWVDWRPPDGSQLLFRGRPRTGSQDVAIYSIGADGTGLRPILPALPDHSYAGPRLSPDGSRLTFSNWEVLVGADSPDGWTHVVDLTTGVDKQMHYDRFAAEVNAVFSPDGKRLLVERQSIVATGPSPSQLIIASVDGTGPVLEIGPSFPYDKPHTFGFSPDGQEAILTFDGVSTQFFRTSDGAALTSALPIPAYPGWQRLAP